MSSDRIVHHRITGALANRARTMGFVRDAAACLGALLVSATAAAQAAPPARALDHVAAPAVVNPSTLRGLPLSAVAAGQALARGAVAWDLRDAAAYRHGHLPGAVQVRAELLALWQDKGDLAALAQAVSQAGIDLSREVVLYGEPGSTQAQALHASLQVLAAGRVHWLVGGTAEWQLSGQSLSQGRPQRAAVPQRLVAFGPLPGQVAEVDHDAQLAGAWARRTVDAPVLSDNASADHVFAGPSKWVAARQ